MDTLSVEMLVSVSGIVRASPLTAKKLIMGYDCYCLRGFDSIVGLSTSILLGCVVYRPALSAVFLEVHSILCTSENEVHIFLFASSLV